ncbi:adenylyl-sulfate kinase [Fundidesulfovibrio terrae]|uniref:adenylyl-sulfate kinase n=1 Tax=Fundidesulfovibrio terrae TaxID=2922866 RepID=UPI001FAF9C1E|nr:adenylyl-sulfate kinase [Fundidesulfovibrio terrae]
MQTDGNAALDDTEGPEADKTGAALWFTGLPGSGKSTLARAVLDVLKKRGLDAVLLQMDARRAHYTPRPLYTVKERAEAYRMFAEEAAGLAGEGRIVLMDGSGPQVAMRERARELIERFAEVHLRCGVTTAMKRESARPEGTVMAGLYAKAMKRKATGQKFEGLGQVIGVDVPFEEDPRAELVLDAAASSTDEMLAKVLERFSAWLGHGRE